MTSVITLRERLHHLGIYLPQPHQKPVSRAEIIASARQRGEPSGLFFLSLGVPFIAMKLNDALNLRPLFADANRPDAVATLAILIVLSVGFMGLGSLFRKIFRGAAQPIDTYSHVIKRPKHYQLGTLVLTGVGALGFVGALAASLWGSSVVGVKDAGSLSIALLVCGLMVSGLAYLEDKAAWRRYARDLEQSTDLHALRDH
jgi:hypothetical protein